MVQLMTSPRTEAVAHLPQHMLWPPKTSTLHLPRRHVSAPSSQEASVLTLHGRQVPILCSLWSRRAGMGCQQPGCVILLERCPAM